jgi:hypothetical protein
MIEVVFEPQDDGGCRIDPWEERLWINFDGKQVQ